MTRPNRIQRFDFEVIYPRWQKASNRVTEYFYRKTHHLLNKGGVGY
jgi:hypothetical protein